MAHRPWQVADPLETAGDSPQTATAGKTDAKAETGDDDGLDDGVDEHDDDVTKKPGSPSPQTAAAALAAEETTEAPPSPDAPPLTIADLASPPAAADAAAGSTGGGRGGGRPVASKGTPARPPPANEAEAHLYRIQDAINAIRVRDVVGVKSYSSPARIVSLVMEAVAVLCNYTVSRVALPWSEVTNFVGREMVLRLKVGGGWCVRCLWGGEQVLYYRGRGI